MFKKIISIILTVAVVCSLVVPAVYADEPDCLTNGHSFSDPPGIMKGFDGEIQGFPVKVSIKYCSKCKFYFHECNVLGIKLEYMSLTGFTGIDGELQAFLFTQIGRIMGSNASASQFQAGGGSASPGGVGRNPSGYAGEGVPSVNSTGVLCMVVEPLGMCSNWTNKGFYTNDNEKLIVGASSSGASYPSDDEVVVYKFVTPASGVYYIGNLNGSSYNYGSISIFSSDAWRLKYLTRKCTKQYEYTGKFDAGQTVYFRDHTDFYHYDQFNTKYHPKGVPYKFSLNPICIFYEPYDTSVNKQTNITINNNTWNGNIYVDNTNKLTYIYPQYTTIKITKP